MSPFVSTHALERAIRSLSSGALDLEAERQAAAYDQLQEAECQIPVPIWGTARANTGWATLDVTFDVQFLFAPEQRDSPLAVPHFTYGAVVSGTASPPGTTPDANNPSCLVAVTCQVVEWGVDLSTGSIIGALLGYGVNNGGGSVEIDFDGYLHTRFQGYGAAEETVSSAGGLS